MFPFTLPVYTHTLPSPDGSNFWCLLLWFIRAFHDFLMLCLNDTYLRHVPLLLWGL